jgi:hypothetical protein
LVAAVAGVAVWLGTRAHHGTGRLPQPAPAPKLVQDQLCQTCAHDYNPYALDGNKTQNPDLVGLAIDGNVNTAWQTQQYYDGRLGKPGVGVYVDASPGVAARELVVYTATPGWPAQIWARDTKPDRDVFSKAPRGWVRLAHIPRMANKQNIPLAAKTRYRYYLVWATGLPHTGQSVSINEIALYYLSRATER